MNEFYIGTFRKACDNTNVAFESLDNRTEIIKKALDNLPQKERKFLEMVYPINSTVNFAGAERRNIERASQEFKMTNDEINKFKNITREKLLLSIENLLKGEKIS